MLHFLGGWNVNKLSVVVLFFWKTHSRSMHAYNLKHYVARLEERKWKCLLFSAIPFMPRRMELSVWYAIRFQLALQNYGQINCKTNSSVLKGFLRFIFCNSSNTWQSRSYNSLCTELEFFFCRWKVQNFLSFRYWHKIHKTSIGLVPLD